MIYAKDPWDKINRKLYVQEISWIIKSSSKPNKFLKYILHNSATILVLFFVCYLFELRNWVSINRKDRVECDRRVAWGWGWGAKMVYGPINIRSELESLGLGASLCPSFPSNATSEADVIWYSSWLRVPCMGRCICMMGLGQSVNYQSTGATRSSLLLTTDYHVASTSCTERRDIRA